MRSYMRVDWVILRSSNDPKSGMRRLAAQREKSAAAYKENARKKGAHDEKKSFLAGAAW